MGVELGTGVFALSRVSAFLVTLSKITVIMELYVIILHTKAITCIDVFVHSFLHYVKLATKPKVYSNFNVTLKIHVTSYRLFKFWYAKHILGGRISF